VDRGRRRASLLRARRERPRRRRAADQRHEIAAFHLRKAEDYFCDLPEPTLAPDMLKLAEHIVASKAADFDPLTFRDRYEEALLAHLKAKQVGAVEEHKLTFAAPRRVINLMEALRRSVAEDKKLAAPRSARQARRPRHANGRECHAAARRNTAVRSWP
jgi:hypothetical protein